MRAAVIQMNSRGDAEGNLARALELADRAVSLPTRGAARGDMLVVLPEFALSLGNPGFYEEGLEGFTARAVTALGEKARQHGMFLHAGSIIERSEKAHRYYASSILFGPDGEQIAAYRRPHLVDLPGEGPCLESDESLGEGRLCVARAGELALGLTITCDVRAPEAYRRLAACGATAMVVAAAFPGGMTDQWAVLLRARAIENLCYVLAANQCGHDASGAAHCGHSMIADPRGKVIAELQEEEGVAVAEIEVEEVRKARERWPGWGMRSWGEEVGH